MGVPSFEIHSFIFGRQYTGYLCGKKEYIFDVLNHQTGDLSGKNIKLNTLLLLLKYTHRWDAIHIESQGQKCDFFSLSAWI